MASKTYCLGNIPCMEEPKILFNGAASSTSTTYTLDDDISKYKLLIVYTAVNNGTYAFSNKSTLIIDVDTMNRNINEYRIYQNNTSINYTVCFSFPTNTTFKLSAASLSTTSWKNPRIYKIIGI